MKIRWKEHETWLATIVTFILVAERVWYLLALGSQEVHNRFGIAFAQHAKDFNFYINVLFPQAAQFMVLYAAYLILMHGIVPMAMRHRTRGLAIGVILLVVLSFMVAAAVNVLSYYGNPHYFNYGGYQPLAMFGFNDRALQNLFDGVDHAILLLIILGGYAVGRELLIQRIDNSEVSPSYRAYVTNKITLGVTAYMILLVLLTTFVENLPERYPEAYLCFALLPSALIVCIVNLYWIFPSNDKTSPINGKTLGKIISTSFIVVLTFSFFVRHSMPGPELAVLAWIAQLIIVTPFSYFVYQLKKEKIAEMRGVQKDLVRSRADLQFLRSQINPHFLFNALNTIYGTAIMEKASRTAEGTQRLGDMMRFMLHENNQEFIPLRREIEYLENYIALQKLRIGSADNIEVRSNISQAQCDHTIAPMLLVPLVENAFKHGISLKQKSWVEIDLQCEARTLRFEVRNSIHPLRSSEEGQNSGVGLKNVQDRLRLLYADKYSFEYKHVDNQFIAQLSIEP